ncbi:adenosine deaminase-like isoform X3 [Acropora palmata]|uniref:adenosine deaminase-like isoform X3 n=1 Tax=Acropora palmata TaxID=6131 RepID=UPI003DA091A1
MTLRLPKSKVELHVHLDGAVRIQTIIDLAKKKQVPLPSFEEECLRHHVSVSLGKQLSLTRFLGCFNVFYPVLINDVAAIERIAHEFCEDEALSGVLYFEVRYCPHLLCTTESVGEDNRVSPRDVVQAVIRGLKRGERDFGVKARSILCCMRDKPGWSLEILSLCQEFSKDGVVGMDLAGDDSCEKILDMNGHVQAFKVCPTSSILTGAVKACFQKHPLRRFAEDGVNFSLNSDDPLVCQTRLDLEHRVVLNEIGLSSAEITRATFNAARASFLSEDDKQELINELKIVHGVC